MNLRRLMPSRNHGLRENATWWLDFEASSGVCVDEGTGKARWGNLAGNAAVSSAGQQLSGTAHLLLPTASGGAAYLSTSLVPSRSQCLPATRDWTLKFRIYGQTYAAAGAGRNILTLQGSSANAADTQFALATSSAGIAVFILSDGTTRSTIVTAPTAMVVSTVYDMEITRRGSTIALTRNGAAYGSGTFSGAINYPGTSGGGVRIGKPVFGSGLGFEGQFDNLRLYVH